MYLLRFLRKGPIAEKRGARLVYRKSALDAFLRENGTDITKWSEGMWRDVADQLRVISEDRPELRFGPLIETLDKSDKDGWDPGQAKQRPHPSRKFGSTLPRSAQIRAGEVSRRRACRRTCTLSARGPEPYQSITGSP